MKDLQPLKPIAEQLLALSVELLRVIDTDEQDYKRLIESVKKTGKLLISRTLKKICLKMRISKRRTATICGNLNTATGA